MCTDVTSMMGAKNISRDEFLELLSIEKNKIRPSSNLNPNQLIFGQNN